MEKEELRDDLKNKAAQFQKKIDVIDEIIDAFRKSSSEMLKSQMKKLQKERSFLATKMVSLYLRIIKINVKLGVKYV